MSLTREQWYELFEDTKSIEHEATMIIKQSKSVGTRIRTSVILRQVRKIKKKIESVVGQLE